MKVRETTSRSSRKWMACLLLSGMMMSQPGCDGGVVCVPAAAGATAVGGGVIYFISQLLDLESKKIELKVRQAELQRSKDRH